MSADENQIDLTPLIAALAKAMLGDDWDPPPAASRTPPAPLTLAEIRERRQAINAGVLRAVKLIHRAITSPPAFADRQAAKFEDYIWLRSADGGHVPIELAAERVGVDERTAWRWEARNREGAA